MTSFFRRIRRKLANDNQLLKYSKYAIGEIFLVVIGILIALTINNWNGERKSNIKKRNYVQKLISDLKKDTIALNSFISWVHQENIKMQQLSDLIDSPDTVFTLDSIINITTRINFLNSGLSAFNDETYQTLIATGDIGLISESQVEQLMILNKLHVGHIQMSESNSEFILGSLKDYLDDFGYLGNPKKNSVYYKTLKRNFDEYEFLKKLRNYMGYKIFIYDLMSSSARDVLEQTTETLSLIKES